MAQFRSSPNKPQSGTGAPELVVDAVALEERLKHRIEIGTELQSRGIDSESTLASCRDDYYSWDEFNRTMLAKAFSSDAVVDDYSESAITFVLGGGPEPLSEQVEQFRNDVARKIRRLKSIKDQLPLFANLAGEASIPSPQSQVFIVHGHHDELKLQTARAVEQLTGRNPIILHEQPDGGRTIIEKFESYASATGFAVVLLTADDRGCSVSEESANLRARQNVVLELGFFLGQLGRSRVVVLYEPGVELPSDMSGVLYTLVDEAGAWKMKLAKEMKAAGIDSDMNNLS